jgi:hypothetical protein
LVDRETRLERLQRRQRIAIVGSRARLPVQVRHGLEIVIHHIRRRGAEDVERALDTATEIRDENLDLRGGRQLAHRADAVDEVLCAAVTQVVAIDAGDHDVLEPQRRDGLREIDGLGRVQRQRAPMADIAERAAPSCRCRP